MSGKNKNRKSRLTEFFRYHRDELSGGERNSFERELQKDPFTEEASDGYKSILPASSDDDYSDLKYRLKVRTSGRKSFILYRIAASVAIVIAVSSIFIVIERSRTSKQIAVNTFQPPILEISKSKPVPGDANSIQVKKAKDQKRKSEKPETKTTSPAPALNQEPSKAVPQPGKSESNNKSAESVELQKNDKSAVLMNEAVVSEIVADHVSAPAGAVARERSLQKVESDKKDILPGYIPPQPVIGKQEFDKYIKENIHRPDSLTTDQTEEVTVSFIVKLNGSLERIRINSSPGKLYSDEAIRLIKSGPAWKPAEKSGKPIEDRVKVK